MLQREVEKPTDSLAEFLQHERLAQVLGVINVSLEPLLTKGLVGARPVVRPHVDGAVVDAIREMVRQIVVAGHQRPCAAGAAVAVRHGVDPVGFQGCVSRSLVHVIDHFYCHDCPSETS